MNASQRWAWVISSVAALGALLVLAFVVGFSSPESRFYERNFVWLFWVNAVVAALLGTACDESSVADAYYGLYRLNVESGSKPQLNDKIKSGRSR